MLAALCALSCSCSTIATKQNAAPYPLIESADLGQMRNVRSMGSIWFGAMPCLEDLELARRRGVERVIDLSTPDEAGPCELAVVCSRLGLEFVPAAIRSDGLPGDESVDFVMKLLVDGCRASSDPALDEVRTLMVDGSGGRCASFVAIYRVLWLDVPLEEALEEARGAGMKPGAPEEFVRAQVARIVEERRELIGT